MKKTVIAVLALALATGCVPKDPKEVVRRVDEKIYYPAKNGLLSFSCRVQSPYVEEMFSRLRESVEGSAEVLDPLKVETRFYWRAGYGGKFLIKGIPDELYQLQNSVGQVFEGTDIVIMPITEQSQFDHFRVTLERERGRLTVVGKDSDPKSTFPQYDLVVEPRSWLIVERRFYGGTFVSVSKPYFQSWKGLRYPVKIETVHDEGEMSYRSLVEMQYQEIKGHLLLDKMTYTFEKPDGQKMVGPVRLFFSEFELNPNIPPDFFQGGKISFFNPEPERRPAPSPDKDRGKKPRK